MSFLKVSDGLEWLLVPVLGFWCLVCGLFVQHFEVVRFLKIWNCFWCPFFRCLIVGFWYAFAVFLHLL